MKYIEFKIETSSQGIEIVTDALAQLGIVNVEIFDPKEILEMVRNPGATEYADPARFEFATSTSPAVTFYMECEGDEPGAAARELTARVREALLGRAEAAARGCYGADVELGSLEIVQKTVDDEDWKDKWKDYFKPVRAGERIWVKPSWESFEPDDPDDIVIEIDPGMAFGTGTHETTSLTLRMLEKYMKPGDRVLDVGCGTGILSIAAAKLGASEVLGIDIESAAVEISNENFRANGVSAERSGDMSAGAETERSGDMPAGAETERSEAVTAGCARAIEGDLTSGIGFTADVVVANLLTGLVLMLTGSVGQHIAEGGLYIASGILNEHRERVSLCLAENGFNVVEWLSDGDWSVVVACKAAL